jgi:hypothetical protein
MANRPRPVPLAPMPDDPCVCRWCLARVRDGRCVRGCQPADSAPYGDVCLLCDRDFQTGNPNHGNACWRCERQELAEMAGSVRHTALIDQEADDAAIFQRDRTRERVRVPLPLESYRWR